MSALTKQIVVRVPSDLRTALQRNARDHGRTEAQSVRFLLRRALPAGIADTETPQ